MWRSLIRVTMLLTAALILASAPSHAAEPKLTAKAVELKETLRDLWLDHVFWERNAALGVSLGEGAAVDVADERVVMNARALADSLAPYYGIPVADRMFSLLAIHYTAVKEYLLATHSNNTQGKDAAKARLMENAGEIGKYLSEVNRNWIRESLTQLFTAHAGHHMVQIENFHVRNYNTEAQVYLDMKRHVYMIADAMAAGIVKQFPQKF